MTTRRRRWGPYVYVYMPLHALAMRNGWVAEHRLVAYDGGLAVGPGDDVHHRNGVKDDNRLENLHVMTHGDHTASHAHERRRSGGRPAPVQKRSWGLTTCPASGCDRAVGEREFCCPRCWKLLLSPLRWRIADDETASFGELLAEAEVRWEEYRERNKRTHAEARDRRSAKGLVRHPTSPERKARKNARARAQRAAARTSPPAERDCA